MSTKKITALTLISLLVFSFIGLFFQQSQVQADTAASSANVTNSVPVASSASIDSGASSITLIEATVVTVTTTATVTDNNGCEDIDSVTVTFYKTTTGYGAADDENNHYVTSTMIQDSGSCTAGGSDLTATYTASTTVWYYADPTDEGSTSSTTDWTVRVVPSDESTGTEDTDTIEMGTLAALNVSSTIVYGALALNGDTGALDTTTTITNTGNEGIDVDVDGYGASDSDGYSMACAWGNVTIGNEKYSSSTDTAYGSKKALTDGAVEVDLDIAQRTSASTTDQIYWGFGLPSTGVGGTCTGIVVFTANSDPNLD